MGAYRRQCTLLPTHRAVLQFLKKSSAKPLWLLSCLAEAESLWPGRDKRSFLMSNRWSETVEKVSREPVKESVAACHVAARPWIFYNILHMSEQWGVPPLATERWKLDPLAASRSVPSTRNSLEIRKESRILKFEVLWSWAVCKHPVKLRNCDGNEVEEIVKSTVLLRVR